MATVNYMKFSDIGQADNGDYLVGFAKDSNGCRNIIKSVSSIIAEARADAGKTLVDASDETLGFLTEKIKNGGGIDKVIGGTDNKDITLSIKLPQEQNKYIETSINNDNELVVERNDSYRYFGSDNINLHYKTGGTYREPLHIMSARIGEEDDPSNPTKPNPKFVRCYFNLCGIMDEDSRSQYIQKVTLRVTLGNSTHHEEHEYFIGWNMDNPYLSMSVNELFEVPEFMYEDLSDGNISVDLEIDINQGEEIEFEELNFHYSIETDDYNYKTISLE